MKKLVLSLLALTAVVTGANAQVIFTENFSYVDGLTTNVAVGVWGRHSGTGNDSFIRNGVLEVFENRVDDVNRPIAGNPAVIYSSFTLTMTNLPTAAGDYFAHYMPAGFRNRVFALRGTNIAAPNSWRLGLSKSTSAANKIFPLDLATNVNYRVVISWDTASQFGTLWVDPVDSSDANIQPTDAGVAGNINAIAFRQTGPAGSGANFGRILVDDLIAGNTFEDVFDGAVKPATIYYDTIPAVSMSVGNSTNLSCVAGGAGSVTFQWQKDNVDLADDPNFIGSQSNRLFIVNAIEGNAGNFKCIVTSTTNSVVSITVTSSVTAVTVSAAPFPPTITQQPAHTTNFFGQTAQLTVAASGVGPFTYAWQRNNSPVSHPNISGDGTATLTITDVQTNNNTTGTYRCDVGNIHGTTPSQNATLATIAPPQVSIGFLRTLVDSTFLLPTNTAALWQATGIVTSHTNLTSAPNCSFYMQDGTGGINVFIGGSLARPAAGDSVTVVGPLGHFNSLLDFNMTTADPAHTIVTNSTGNPIPAAVSLAFNFTNTPSASNAVRFVQGSLVTLTNVYFPVGFTGTNNFGSGVNVTVTNAAGQGLTVRVDSRVFDIIGQRVPPYGWTITGPMGYFLSSTDPDRSKGFQLLPTRFADIVSKMPASVSLAGPNPVITWQAGPNVPYSVWRATDVDGSYAPIVTGLIFGTTSGTYTDTGAPSGNAFYQITSP